MGVGVEEDAVGAVQLLEGGERHAHADEATPLRTQHGEDAKGLVDAAERALDGLNLRGDIVGARQTLKRTLACSFCPWRPDSARTRG